MKTLHGMKYFFSYALILLLINSFSEDDILTRLLSSLKKQNEQFPVEKIYVHTDKPYFLSGEKIWLKSYLVAGPTHLPSPLSKIVYVDLLTPNNEIVKHLTLFSKEGLANGTIELPDSLPSGNYTLTAYTKWMQNFSCDYYFRQDVRIWNVVDNPSKEQSEIKISETKIDLQLFPEGGNLISGIINKVGFKAIDQKGLGIEIKGKVIDGNGQEVIAFQSNPLGMGSFLLTPNLNSEYSAVLDKPYKLAVKLPASAALGTGFSIVNNPNKSKLLVKIRHNNTKPTGSFYLIGQARGVTCYAAKVDLNDSYLNTAIEKKKFPTGVTQFTLFDYSGKPIAERLVYIDHQEKAIVKITSDKTIYKPREKVSMSIEVTNQKGEPQSADLSLSIVDTQNVLIDENNANIISFFDLTSDLKGNIESPGYYFNPKNEDRYESLDALMLTQGWRRFNWEDISADKWPVVKWAPEKGFAIRGRLMDKTKNKPIAKGKVMMLSGEVSGDIILAESSTDGSFVLKDIHVYDTAKITLSAANRSGDKSQVKIELDTLAHSPNCSIDIHRDNKNINETLTDFEKSIINRGLRQQKIDAAYNLDEKTILLEGVEVTATRSERSPSRVFGEGDVTVRAEDIPGSKSFTHPLQFLQGKAGVVVRSSSSTSYSVTVRGASPVFLLDDIVIDLDALALIPAASIESVVVLKGPPAAIFAGAEGGAILFYSKKGGGSNSGSSTGKLVLTKMGYQVPKEFYSPKYDVVKPEHVKPDERVVLFWSSTIKTDSQGKATIEFYNHDLECTVVGIAQGITSSGAPLYSSINYRILK